MSNNEGNNSGMHENVVCLDIIPGRQIPSGSSNNNSRNTEGGCLPTIRLIRDLLPLKHGCEDNWTWSKLYCSTDIVLSGQNNRTVHFHPNWSSGTAGVAGTRCINNGRHFWELHITKRLFGTSIMFGIGTRQVRLDANVFLNMLGEDEHGWGLSHKGAIWHGGHNAMYTQRFKENIPTQIGVFFDGIEGTLTYYKDGKCLGVAFCHLDKIQEPLYPIVCSTAAMTEMTLNNTRREFLNLQDRCRAVIMKHIKTSQDLEQLMLPGLIKRYLCEVLTRFSNDQVL